MNTSMRGKSLEFYWNSIVIHSSQRLNTALNGRNKTDARSGRGEQLNCGVRECGDIGAEGRSSAIFPPLSD